MQYLGLDYEGAPPKVLGDAELAKVMAKVMAHLEDGVWGEQYHHKFAVPPFAKRHVENMKLAYGLVFAGNFLAMEIIGGLRQSAQSQGGVPDEVQRMWLRMNREAGINQSEPIRASVSVSRSRELHEYVIALARAARGGKWVYKDDAEE